MSEKVFKKSFDKCLELHLACVSLRAHLKSVAAMAGENGEYPCSNDTQKLMYETYHQMVDIEKNFENISDSIIDDMAGDNKSA